MCEVQNLRNFRISNLSARVQSSQFFLVPVHLFLTHFDIDWCFSVLGDLLLKKMGQRICIQSRLEDGTKRIGLVEYCFCLL